MKNLNEVSFLRPLLVFLLVFYHAFCVYNNMWKEPVCFEPNQLYLWFDRLSYSFLLETYVFISGYIWAFQMFVLHKEIGLFELIKRKAVRLLIPSFIFSALYLLLINRCGCNDYFHFLWATISGAGHLWFLPMLFWCFIFTWFIYKIKCHEGLKLFIVILVGLLECISLPFQLDKSLYYLQFFYLGFILIKYRNQIWANISASKVVLFWFLFLFLFFTLTLLKEELRLKLLEDVSIILKAILYPTMSFITALYAFIGTLSFYLSAVLYCKNKSLKEIYISIGKYCFGVYIFQQFILQVLYYKTPLPVIVGPVFLPWIGFVVALLLSFVLSYLVRLSKLGRIYL